MKRRSITLLAMMLTGVLFTQTVSAGIFKEDLSSYVNGTGETTGADMTYTDHLGTYTSSKAEYGGCMVDGLLDGYGMAVYTDGDFHYGLYEQGMRNGLGLYCFEDGDILISSDVNDETEGEGIYIYSDGSVFAGMYSDNIRDGEGVLIDTAKDNQITMGEWVAGSFETKYNYDTWTEDDWTFYGRKVNGAIDGWGIMTCETGDLYVGEFSQGYRQGFGLYVFADIGAMNAANFQNGEILGMSVYMSEDGQVLIGNDPGNGIRGLCAMYEDRGTMTLVDLGDGDADIIDQITIGQ